MFHNTDADEKNDFYRAQEWLRFDLKSQNLIADMHVEM